MCDQESDLWQQLKLTSELKSDLWDTGLRQEVTCWLQCWKNSTATFNWSNNIGAIDVKMDGSVLDENLPFRLLGLTFSSKLGWSYYIISTVKISSKKIAALNDSMNFLSPEVALYLYKSTIRPYMEHCCRSWADAPSFYLGLLDKLRKWISRNVGPSLAASLETVAHCLNVARLSLLHRYHFGRCSSELAQLVPLPYSGGEVGLLFW